MAIVEKLPPEEREVPHEPGNYMSFRPLSNDEMADARAGTVRELVSKFGPDISRLFFEIERKQAEQANRKDDEMTVGEYSTPLLLRGVVAWRGPEYEGLEPPQEHVGKLDSTTAIWAARQVLEVSRIAAGEERNSGAGTETSGPGDSESHESSDESGLPSPTPLS